MAAMPLPNKKHKLRLHMKNKISPFVLDFLHDLSENNNREWFNDNKSRWQTAKADFLEFVENLMPGLYRMDNSIGIQSAEKCMYRIHRDIRFSPDKTPYKVHLAAYIATGGVKRHGRPGYYIHIENNNSGCGGGIFMPETDTLTAIRKEIYYNIDIFKSIIDSNDFKKYYPQLWQIDMLKQAPKGFPKDFKGVEWLKYKHYVTMCDFTNTDVLSNDFGSRVMDAFRATYPLNKFIIDAMN